MTEIPSAFEFVETSKCEGECCRNKEGTSQNHDECKKVTKIKIEEDTENVETPDDTENVETPSDTVLNPMQCPVCFKIFRSKSVLKVHISNHSRVFKCDVCSKTFHYRQVLKHHMLSHLEDRPYKCPKCFKTFRYSQVLDRHMTIHSEKLHKCDKCPKAFRLPGYLREHQRIHSEERPFSCDICSRTFRHAKTMQRHVLTHSEECPYMCEHCSKKFRTQKGLKSHLLQHTPNYKKKPLNREKPKKKWTQAEHDKLLDFLFENTALDKPSPQAYYRRLLEETNIDATWDVVQLKVRYLRKRYIKAVAWRDSKRASIEAGDEKIIKQFQRMCPHYERLTELFVHKLNSDIKVESPMFCDTVLGQQNSQLHNFAYCNTTDESLTTAEDISPFHPDVLIEEVP